MEPNYPGYYLSHLVTRLKKKKNPEKQSNTLSNITESQGMNYLLWKAAVLVL